jgi:hypothetical protein
VVSGNRIITYKIAGTRSPPTSLGRSSGDTENVLDLAGGDPIHLGHLRGRHPVLQPRADAGDMRYRDDGFPRRRGAGRRCWFISRDGHRRGDRQHAWFPNNFASGCRFPNGWFDALGSGCKERLGRPTRACALLATIAAIVMLWGLIKQDCSAIVSAAASGKAGVKFQQAASSGKL